MTDARKLASHVLDLISVMELRRRSGLDIAHNMATLLALAPTLTARIRELVPGPSAQRQAHDLSVRLRRAMTDGSYAEAERLAVEIDSLVGGTVDDDRAPIPAWGVNA
jgi:hypothetical protein